MSSDFVSPAEARFLSERHVMLIDIRGHDEWRREHISSARSLPLEQLKPGCLSELLLRENDTILFYCQSGIRTNNALAQIITVAHPAKALIVEGGLNAWKAAGYPVQVDRSKPFPLMRQVQIIAGALILCSTLAGTLLSPAFYAIAGFVGAGLVFAGVTGWCGMAKVLGGMPWNK